MQTVKMFPSPSALSILWALLLAGCMCLLFTPDTVRSVQAMSLLDAQQQQQALDGGRPQANTMGPTLAVVESPELTVRVLESLIRSLIYSTSAADLQAAATANVAQKRGLDLGISRGFSGSQAGKHLMGLSAASFANGPGR